VAAEPAAATTKTASGGPAKRSTNFSSVQVGGILAFAASYGIAFAIPAIGGFRDGREWMAAPVLGPAIGLVRGTALPWGLALDELGQLVGISLIIAGDNVSWTSTAGLTRPGGCPTRGLCLRGSF
jgi:hypothetical protein